MRHSHNNIVWYACALALCLLHVFHEGYAQDISKVDIRQLDELSFDALLDIDLLQVASKKPLSKKDVPGVVTLIKREEIQNSGARDIIDVLRLVPGIEFGGDVQGVVGIGNRGNWANEGKALIMIDGLQVNEFLFATVPLANRFPLENIERIEIIRGPGSSFYGGFAELLVINIITRAPEDVNGLWVLGHGGHMETALGRLGCGINFGKKFGNVAVGVSAYTGYALMSDREYVGLDGQVFPMTNNHVMMPLHLNTTVKAGGLQARVLYDRYNTMMRNGIGATLPQSFSTNFTSLITDVRYDIKISDAVTITPRVNYTRQQPWNLIDSIALEPSSPFNFLVLDKTVERAVGSLQVSADVSKNVFVTLGTEYYVDYGTASEHDPVSSLWSNPVTGEESRTIQYSNIGVFLQALLTTDIVNVNTGLRLDRHSAVPLALVPWLGVTKTIGNFNFKALFGQNFRAPSIENIRLYPQIKPELTTALEVELGYQLSYNMFVSTNIFDISIQDAIVFGGGGYRNFARTNTRGIELEYFVKDAWGSINLGYSFYIANNEGFPDSVRALNPYRVWSFRVHNGRREVSYVNDNVLLGFAPHKVVVNAMFNLARWVDGLTISPSCVFLSERYAVSALDFLNGIQTVQQITPTVLLNFFIHYKNAFQIPGLDVGIGVYDVLGSHYGFIQPFNIGNAILPGPSREVVAKLAYWIRW
ncbi:MAG: TonB-dependent receptor plug domain-containing protein [Bacteroidota bacterium]|nr:TonB-dependent receptor plug domain-containing protein [Candidatus Kapabacteria bacterium]MDW8219677.1 TonB-dependent receptor plug domain-containing protein [Bacteroidota bacterium]